MNIYQNWGELINYNLNRCLENLNKSKKTSIFDIFNFKYNIFKKKPEITVIIPIYNCQNTIRLSLASIQNQNMTNLEIILIKWKMMIIE